MGKRTKMSLGILFKTKRKKALEWTSRAVAVKQRQQWKHATLEMFEKRPRVFKRAFEQLNITSENLRRLT